MELTRHDMPEAVKDVINAAVSVELIDAIEVYVLAESYGTDWIGLVDDIVEIADCARHENTEANEVVCPAADRFWIWAEKIRDTSTIN